MDMTHCPNYTRVAWCHGVMGRDVAVRLRCKSWGCDYCAKKNASIWRAHLLQRLPEVSDEWWILTLTAPPWARSRAESIKSIRKSVEAFFKRCKRVFGEAMDYVRVYEKHPTSNALHSHFIVSGFTPFVAMGCSVKLQPVAVGITSRPYRSGVWAIRTWIKKTCQELKMGRIADCQKIEGPAINPVLYVMKYTTKAQQDLGIKGLRHIQTTRRIGGPKQEGNPNWKTGPYLTRYTFPKGSKIIDLNTGEIIGDEYWEKYSLWPYD